MDEKVVRIKIVMNILVGEHNQFLQSVMLKADKHWEMMTTPTTI